MRKFGWDLPPGVTTSMLPGNTPEDAIAEAQADAIYEALTKCGYYDVTALDDASDAKADKAVEVFSKLLSDAYAAGRVDGMADEAMAAEFACKDKNKE